MRSTNFPSAFRLFSGCQRLQIPLGIVDFECILDLLSAPRNQYIWLSFKLYNCGNCWIFGSPESILRAKIIIGEGYSPPENSTWDYDRKGANLVASGREPRATKIVSQQHLLQCRSVR